MSARGGGARRFYVYTVLRDHSGAGRSDAAVAECRRLVEDRVREHGAAQVRREGDDLCVELGGHEGALRCAVDILLAVECRLRESPALPIHVGVGLHAFPVPARRRAPEGSALNVAAGLARVATGGELLVSEAVADLLGDSEGPRMEERRGLRLVGVKGPLRAFAVDWHRVAERPEAGRAVTFLPRLNVRGPDGQTSVVLLRGERVTIGRLSDHNDVALAPDPHQWIGRRAHCRLERVEGTWWVIDNGSVNGTYVRRGEGRPERIQSRAQLVDGDVIRILGGRDEGGEPAYWELRFGDPSATRLAGVGAAPSAACLEYDPVRWALVRVEGAERRPIALRPQEHKLVRYMARRNAENGNVPVLCGHEDLMAAVWGEEPHTQDELNRLVHDLRAKLGDSSVRRLVENQPGLGYRLLTCS